MERPSIQIRKILRSPSVKRKNKIVPVSERVSKVSLIVNSLFCILVKLYKTQIYDFQINCTKALKFLFVYALVFNESILFNEIIKTQIHFETRNAWQSLACSPFGTIVSPRSEYL